MRLCIIPARGGSKRIPRKNVRNFRGKPMIAWSIEAALRCRCFDKVIISTDDQEISEVAAMHGVSSPFWRPSELSGDYTSTQDVIVHSIQFMQEEGIRVTEVCCLYATAPFVTVEDIELGYSLLIGSRANTSVYPATKYSFPIQRSIRIDSDGYASAFDINSMRKRSQDLEDYFHDAGQFYWASAETWLNADGILNIGRPIIVPSWRVQDIDTEDDWKRAELVHSLLEAL